MLSTLASLSNRLLSALAGVAAFVLTLLGFLMLSRIDQQIGLSLLIGLFALAVVWMASERPNGEQARAVSALIDRLLAVGRGDLSTPAPAVLRRQMPALADAVDGLFGQVRSNLEGAQALAMYDPVTSLPNRIHFKREAERILKSRRPEDKTALLFIDLDGFKEVNDLLGHAEGDEVLTLVAQRLQAVLEREAQPGSMAQPLLARLAGDEFTLLLPDIGGVEEAQRIGHRALAALAEPFRTAGHMPCLGASIGVALSPDHGDDPAGLMKAADIAMYRAKAKGRSRVCVYEPRMALAAEERVRAEAAALAALKAGKLSLGFQPQVCLRSGAVVGGEASILWNGTHTGVPESAFGGTVDCGLSLEMSDWALERAAETILRWRRQGLPHRLAVRVTPRQIERADFFPELKAALEQCGPAPWPLELVVSESGFATCDVRVLDELEALRRNGVSVAVSEFGAGRSSLARITELPLDRVKFDTSLIADVDRSEKARTVLASLVHLIHGLGCEAIAVGAERQDQIEVLRGTGCNTLEGLFGAAAMREETFVRWAGAQGVETLARAS
jgi:diguanylate cyclase (GGDEF)-like protein